MRTTFDAIVIGGGSAGLAFSKEAAQRGASVLLVERDRLGGTCVNRGCVPKKMMWAVSDTMQTQTKMADQGIFATSVAVDLATLSRIRNNRISDIVDSFDTSLEEHGVKHIADEARMLGGGKIRVREAVYETENIVIATGTRPSSLDINGGSLMASSDDVFGWTSVPKRLVVIGGGYIGCEMAAIFNGFGSDVTIVSHGADILTEFSGGAQKIAAANLKASGVRLVLNEKPVRVAKENDGTMIVDLSDGRQLQAEQVLNATGRDPNLDIFGGMDTPDQAENGTLNVNTKFRTSQGGVYAIGDVSNRLPLTPVAREDGKTLARQLFGSPEVTPIDLELVATTAFVFPPIGEVGQTKDISSITTFTAMEQMLAEDGLEEGWALARSTEGGLAGATVVGHAAAEAISWAAPSIVRLATRAQMDQAVSVHPSKAEEPLGSDV